MTIHHLSIAFDSPIRINGDPMTRQLLHDFADDQLGRGLSPNTVRNRASILLTLERKTGISLLEMQLPHLRRYLGREGEISAGTRRTERGAFVAFYGFLRDEGYRDDDPTTRLKPVKAPKGEPRPFTLQQINAMLESGAYFRTRAMILVGYYQGFRVAMIARVHGRDIDFDSNTIATVGKGNKEARLPMHPVVRELAKIMPRDKYWFPARKHPDRHVRPASVTNLITLAKKRAGIVDPKLTPHSLKHSFCTHLIDAGVDVRVVQVLAMHESLATTQIYTGVSNKLRQDAIHAIPSRTLPAQSGRTVTPLAA